jgi:hypothetical protein
MATRKVIRKFVLNGEQYFTQDNWVTTIKQWNTTLWTIAADQATNQTITIPSPAEQVQANWSQTDSTAGDYIKNKPTLWTAAALDTWTAQGNIPVLWANGKLADSTLPALAITDTISVTNKSELLTSGAQKWDVGIVSSINKCFILSADDPTVEANWKELKTPTDAVLSVNGRTGAVTISEFSPSWTATTWYVLVKTASGYGWAENVGKVSSVNWKTWTVVINADDIDDTGTTNKFVSQTEKDTWNGKADESDIGNGTISVKVAWVDSGSFTTNQSTAGTLNLPWNKILTQTEYNNLPASKTSDNNLHAIYETVTTD